VAIIRWEPFRELSGLRNSINRLFDDSFHLMNEPGEVLGRGLGFPVDIKDTPEAIMLKAELPGLDKEDIKVSLNDDTLTIQGERKKEEKEEGAGFLRIERSYGSFIRSFVIDTMVKQDEIKARYQDGILEVTLPKEKVTRQEQFDVKVE